MQLQKEKGALLLRYFGPKSAEELLVPQEELRNRDPRSGNLLTSSATKTTTTAVIQRLSLRGRYGIGIEWSDGRHEDIFSFEALRRIALEVASSRR